MESKLNAPIDNQSGFSLLEILIAITLLGFLSISIFTITNNSIDTKESVLKEDREFLQVYTAMFRLDKDFSEIYSPLYYQSLPIAKKGYNNANSPYGGSPNYQQQQNSAKYKFQTSQNFPLATVNNLPIPNVTQEDKTSLRFMTSSNKRYVEDQKQSRYAWVEYFLAPDDRGDLATAAYQIMRREIKSDIYNPNLDFEKTAPHVLLRGVKEFKFEFYGRTQQKWVDGIKYLTNKERYTPRTMRITLVWVDLNKVEHTQIRIFRPYWPYFDVVKDETLRQSLSNTSSSQKPKTGI